MAAETTAAIAADFNHGKGGWRICVSPSFLQYYFQSCNALSRVYLKTGNMTNGEGFSA